MRVYNAEFFRPDYSFITARQFSEMEYSFDYVSPDSNSFLCETVEGVSSGDWIQITGGERPIYGIVDHIDDGAEDKKLSEVFINQMTALFRVPILFDTDLQPGSGSGSSVTLEEMIADFVRKLYGNNEDALQNIRGLTVRTTSATPEWGFNLKSTYEGMHHLIINFWESILARALVKYQVIINAEPDFAAKTMTVTIGKSGASTKVIEADLPNVVEKSIIVGRSESAVNKAVIYNGADYGEHINFYLHPGGTYDTDNNNRITPVIFEVRDVDMAESTRTFAQAAASAAVEVFGGAQINNNITLTVLPDDEMVNPAGMEIGQMVQVISDGISYTSMLTGYSFGELATVVFGTVRTELTKII